MCNLASDVSEPCELAVRRPPARTLARAAILVEVPAQDRAPVIRAYLLRSGRRSGSAQVAREARDYFGIDADSAPAQIGSVADRYPAFHVVSG
jgi:hypothetical protein